MTGPTTHVTEPARRLERADGDPRPILGHVQGHVVVLGGRCPACGLVTVADTDACPECAHELDPAGFGPGGRVVASTVLRVGVPGHEPPYAIGYVVLDDGPRVLVHLDGTAAVPVGTVVVLAEPGPDGDLRAVVADEEQEAHR